MTTVAMAIYWYLIGLGYLAAGMWTVRLVVDHRRHHATLPRERRWDSTEAEVAALPADLRGVDLDAVPVVPGEPLPPDDDVIIGGWTPARPDDTPGTVVPDDAPAEQPWAAKREAFAAIIEAQRRRVRTVDTPTAAYRPIPRTTAPTPAATPLLVRPPVVRSHTREFAALVQAETGQPLTAVGPREADITAGRWAQDALDFEQVT